jgi:hypothetical protein
MKIHDFSNIRELLNNIKKTNYRSAANEFLENSRNREWAGVAGKDEYMDYLLNGYAAGVEELSAEVTKAEGQAFRLVPSVAGIFYNVSAFIEDRPECMARFEAVEENTFLNININTATPSTIKGGELMQKAKNIFKGVNTLETSGTRCKITITTGVKTDDNGTHVLKLLIKDYQDTLISGYHGLLIANHGTTRGVIYSYLSQFTKKLSIGKPINHTINADIEISMNEDNEKSILIKLAGGQSGI